MMRALVRILEETKRQSIEEYLIPESLLIEAFDAVDFTKDLKEKLVYFAGRIRERRATLERLVEIEQIGNMGLVTDTPKTLEHLRALEQERLELLAIGHSHPEWGLPTPSSLDWDTIEAFQAGYGPLLGMVFSIDAHITFYTLQPVHLLIVRDDNLPKEVRDGCYKLPITIPASSWTALFRAFADGLD
jgi:hypothetical protein